MKVCFLYMLFIISMLGVSFSPVSAVVEKESALTDPGDIYALMASRIRKEAQVNIRLPEIEKTVVEALEQYNRDGSFSDVDYGARNRTEWPPLKHIDRLYDLAFAYTVPGNPRYQDSILYNIIANGLSFWYDRNPRCNNWWYNQIAEPQRIGILLLQMQTGEKQLPADLVSKTAERMRTDGGNPAKQTGPNKTDIALHWLYRACLTKDADLLEQTMEQAFEPLRYTTGEGIQYDNSYFQHGRQFYVIGYGDALLKGVTQFALYADGTAFQLDRKRLELFDRFVRDSYLKVIRGQYCFFNAMGRGMSRANATRKGQAIRYCESMASLLPEQADEYDQAIARLSGEKPAEYAIHSGNTLYFTGDYVLHTRPGYSFGVRAVSSRTLRNEYGNGENADTYFVSDGSTHIAVRGDEYYNIFPVWNWSRIPGVTAPDMNPVPKTANDWQTCGTSTFTGGVSDSLYAAFTYVYEDRYAGINTAAKKSWFFFDEEVVCLGAGIRSSSAFPVRTTVNQCLLQSDIVESEEGVKWVWQGGIGYLFPEGGNIRVSGAEQSGSWKRINANGREDVGKKPVFTLCLDHGLQPKQATYAYIVVPGKHTAQEMGRHDVSHLKILANSDSLQAVQNQRLKMWQLVFFKPGSFSYQGNTVTVDAPCVVQLSRMDSRPVLHIADPGHRQAKITVEISGSVGKTARILCDFTGTDVYAGKSKSYSPDILKHGKE